MSFAKVVFAVSSVGLVAVVSVGVAQRQADPRADLVGSEVRISPTTAVPKATVVTRRRATAPSTASTPSTAFQRPRTIPRLLTISSLNISADIVSVGLEPDGTMEIPDVSEAGWYHYGVAPGSPIGSAVIAAHVDSKGQAGVFFRLAELSLGEEIAVTNAEGVVSKYRVTERYQVDKDELPAPELFRTEGPPMLTLITCGGEYNPSLRRYADNIVVRGIPLVPLITGGD